MAARNMEKGHPCEKSTFTEVTSSAKESSIEKAVIYRERSPSDKDKKGHLMTLRNIEKGYPCEQSTFTEVASSAKELNIEKCHIFIVVTYKERSPY
jgi:hypothetical protein